MNTQQKPRFSAQKKNADHMALLLSSPRFEVDVKVIRDEFGICEGGNTRNGDQERWLSTLEPRVHEYSRAVNRLARDHNAPANYHRHIQEYIEQRLVSGPVNRFSVTPPNIMKHAVVVEVYSNLTQQEYAELNAQIKRMSKDLPSFGAIKDIGVMLESEYMYKDCATWNEKEDREYELTLKERAGKGVNEAYEHMRTLNEQRKKRFGKK